MVKGVQHKCHNEEGCQSGHGWHHLDNQEEDQTLFTSQEVVTAIGITSKYDNTCLDSHGNQGDNQVLRYKYRTRFREEPLEVSKTKVRRYCLV